MLKNQSCVLNVGRKNWNAEKYDGEIFNEKNIEGELKNLYIATRISILKSYNIFLFILFHVFSIGYNRIPFNDRMIPWNIC